MQKKMNKERKDRIKRQKIRPRTFETAQPEIPDEWTEEVYVPRARKKLENYIRRRLKWRNRFHIFVDTIGILFPRIQPITNRLIMSEKKSFIDRVKGVVEKIVDAFRNIQESTYEGLGWIFVIAVIILGYFGLDVSQVQLMELYEIGAGIVALAVAFYYAVKDIFVKQE